MTGRSSRAYLKGPTGPERIISLATILDDDAHQIDIAAAAERLEKFFKPNGALMIRRQVSNLRAATTDQDNEGC